MGKKVRTGIYGGSFNPIHNGHIAMAERLLSEKMVDEVWLVVSPLNPLKQDLQLWPDEVRLDLARQAVKDIRGIEVSDVEMSLPRPSYMAKTLECLSEKYSDREFVLIIGRDNWDNFDHWYNWRLILQRYQIIVLPRKKSGDYVDSVPGDRGGDVTFADFPLIDMSSSWIRSQIQKNVSYEGKGLPSVVWQGIRRMFSGVSACAACLLIMIMCLASCNPEVEMCTDHNHQGRVHFAFDWSEVDYHHPDSVHVLGLRPVRREKYLWRFPSEVDTFVDIPGGEYELTAYTGYGDLSGMQSEEFKNNYTTSAADLQVSYDLATTLTDPRYRGQFLNLKDRNPYSCYFVGADSSSLFTATTAHELPLTVTLPDSLETTDDDTVRVTFKMHAVTQRVTLKFSMRCQDIDGIDSVKCIMSGVGKSVHITNGNVNIDTTYKAPFAPREAMVPDETGLYNVSHTIDVPGIVRNQSPTAVSGPGILQVDVYVHYLGEEGMHNVVLTGIMNLYKLLAKTPSLVYDSNDIPTQSAREITLDVDNVMLVSKDRIAGSIEGSLGTWIDDSEVTIDY